MLEYITDENGKITACISWDRYTKYMEYSPAHTDEELCIAYSDTFWRHKDCHLSISECIEEFALKIADKYPKLLFGSFHRTAEGRKTSKQVFYKLERFLRRRHGKQRTDSLSASRKP